MFHKTVVTRFRALMNKLTLENAEVLFHQVEALQFDDKELCHAANILLSKAASEPQYHSLHIAVVKCKPELLSATVEQLSIVPYLEDENAQRAKAVVEFFCGLRHAGLMKLQHFRKCLDGLFVQHSFVVDCVCALPKYSSIVSEEMMTALKSHAKDWCSTMRHQFMFEEAFGILECKKKADDEQNFAVTSSPTKQRITSACTLYLSYIDCNASEWELSVLIRNIGEINRVRLCGNCNQSTQYAFVEFDEEKSAKKALAMDGKTLLGKYALRWSASKSVIQDKNDTDALMGKNGKCRACTFGYNANGTPNKMPLRNSTAQQAHCRA